MLYHVKKIICVLLACWMTMVSSAQTTEYATKKIAATALRSDFLLLRDTLQKIHPSMYRYNSKEYVDHIFDSCYSVISDSMSLIDFYMVTRFAIATIGDGHANCKLSRDVMNDYMNHVKVFPAMLMFINNRAFIFCCKQNEALAGTELLTINRQPVNKIVQQLFKYITTDGKIQSRKNWELPEEFHLLFNTACGARENYTITYKGKKGETGTAVLKADIINNFICKSPFARPAKYLNLVYSNSNTAILTLQTFFDGFLQQTGENFKQFLDSSFRDIKEKKVSTLLIDVRSNQGGNDANGALLYSYLSKDPFRYYASLETVAEKFTASGHSLLGLQQSNENNFSGKVYILMNGRSFSGAAEFASIVKTNNRGIFIGEECGGGYYGNSSGDEAMVTLPNSNITARIPLIKYTMAVKKTGYSDRGVIPDYTIYPTVSDIINHVDGQMKYALEIAVKK